MYVNTKIKTMALIEIVEVCLFVQGTVMVGIVW
jgi:hypothetical protein